MPCPLPADAYQGSPEAAVLQAKRRDSTLFQNITSISDKYTPGMTETPSFPGRIRCVPKPAGNGGFSPYRLEKSGKIPYNTAC